MGQPHGDGAGSLEMSDVSARYPGGHAVRALSGVTLQVAPGEVVAVLGSNGAGKSTLLRVAARLLPAEEGQIRVGGRDAQSMTPRELSRFIAFVPQGEATPRGFSVRDVVSMGRAPHQNGWMREGDADRAVVGDALQRCDLVHLADRNVEALSGGEQRRVSMARALAQEPTLLLLDEPAAFLDVRHRLELHDLLADVVPRRGLACLITTHDLDTAFRLAGRVILLREGRVVISGPPAEVLTTEAVAEALGVDIHSGVHAATGERYFLPHRRA